MSPRLCAYAARRLRLAAATTAAAAVTTNENKRLRSVAPYSRSYAALGNCPGRQHTRLPRQLTRPVLLAFATRMSTHVDWYALSATLASKANAALFILSQDGRIRLINERLEDLLGVDRVDMVGRLWRELCIPSDAEAWEDFLRDALRGAARRTTCHVSTRGNVYRLSLDVTPMGYGDATALLAEVTAYSRLQAQTASNPRSAYAIAYEISLKQGEQGRILFSDNPDFAPFVGGHKRCYEVFFARHEPCTGCPLLDSAYGSPAPFGVLRPDDPGDVYRLVIAEANDGNTARLSMRLISDDMLKELLKARLDTLAREAGLTKREQQVLDLMLLGRTLAQIGTALAISTRTAKFHQSNVLEKLGADSRFDIPRLLF